MYITSQDVVELSKAEWINESQLVAVCLLENTDLPAFEFGRLLEFSKTAVPDEIENYMRAHGICNDRLLRKWYPDSKLWAIRDAQKEN